MVERTHAASRPGRAEGPPPETELVACALCGGTRTRPVAVKFGLRIVRCRECGFIFSNPRLARTQAEKRYESPEFFSEYLTAHRATPRGFDLDFLRGHFGLYLSLLEGRRPQHGRLLDVGCGGGFFLKAAEAAGWTAEGTEISRRLAGYARSVVGMNVHLGTLEELHWSPGTFDVVTMFDVLEHVPDPPRTVAEACRLLKTGGLVLISTPDYDSLSRLFLGKAWAVLSPAEHLSLFTAKTLRSLTERAGLSVLGIRNLLVFNPEYTHRKGFRYSFWKGLHGRLTRFGLSARLMAHEHREATAVGPGTGEGGAPPKGLRKLAVRLYGKARNRLRGDILVVLAQKRD